MTTIDDDRSNLSQSISSSFIGSLHMSQAQLTAFLKGDGNFLYLTHSNEASRSAYDLSITDHQSTNPGSSYYTLSRAGITHFTKDGTTEFTPLDQWEREFQLFGKMRQINFFKSYRMWKTFSVWKKNIKNASLASAREALVKNLFIFIPSLRDALMTIKSLCVSVTNLRLIDVASKETLKLDSFIKSQHALQESLTTELSSFSVNIHNTVRGACDEIVDEFLKSNNIVADHRMTFMERASLRSECRKLTKFLKLTDFLVVDTLHDMALESVSSAVASMKGDWLPEDPTIWYDEKSRIADKAQLEQDFVGKELPKPCLFSLEVSMSNDGVVTVSPSQAKIRFGIEQVISQSLRVIDIPERVFSHEELQVYIMEESEDADEAAREEVPVQDVVSDDEIFKRLTEEIYENLDVAFSNVTSYATIFSPFRETWLSNHEEVENLEGKYSPDEGKIDLEEYKTDINKYKGQQDSFATIPFIADVGIFTVDSSQLKDELMPSPLRMMKALKDLLPELMSKQSTSLLSCLEKIVPVIERGPEDVRQFVHKKNTVLEAVDNIDKYKEEQAHIHDMEMLMNEMSWTIPDHERVHIVMVGENMRSLEDGIEKAQSKEEEEVNRFSAEVDADIPKLNKKIQALREALDKDLIVNEENYEHPGDVIAYLGQQLEEQKALQARAEELQDFEEKLGKIQTEYDNLDEVIEDLKLKSDLWKGVDEWSHLRSGWVESPLQQMDIELLERTLTNFQKLTNKASKKLPGNPVVPRLRDSVVEFLPVLPVVVNLLHPSLQDRHWEMIHEAIGFEIKGENGLDPTFTVGAVIEKEVTAHAERIEDVSTNAQQESVLEGLMAKVDAVWKEKEFEVKNYKDVKDLYILGDTSEVVADLDDSLVTINTVLGSRYVGGIREMVDDWRSKLMIFQETLDEWLMCQRTWMYLESIFSSPDIVKQLPDAAKKFQAVDKSWKSIMKMTNDDPNALAAGTYKDRKETFVSHNVALDKIQKNLEEYLETKRAAFPRFYFLSNDELLEILSQAKDPQAVQPHLRKCFDNIVTLDFGVGAEDGNIIAMNSQEGEKVELGTNLRARGSVETWLTNVENRMKFSLHEKMKAGLLDYDEKIRKEWILVHPGQVVATVAQMTWARDTERALSADDPKSAMRDWSVLYKSDLNDLIIKIRGDLTKLQRKTIVALVTTDVHARDIIDELIDQGVEDTGDFTWQVQLRYYWKADQDEVSPVVHHSDAVLLYGYEYMGATSRLVITPLTDRCWLTLTGSYGLKLGAAPAGPAGTGKTESSKDLAKALAINCVVFNCSDQIDYKMMGKLFRGLAQSGGWTCLDEFNRIDIEVLSVVAQQMVVLREGRIASKSSINFMGVQIVLKDHHVIITMNPGYAGRTELPDNLQVCFRPVSMMVPNYALIAEIMLFAEGFGDAKTLSRKMCKLYILCSEQLSQQPHYDYGLRAVKSVLVMAGGLKRGNPDLSEDLVLIRALRDSNVPKFLADDLPLFGAIVLDLFPGVSIPDNDYGEFAVTMHEEIEKAGLQKVDKFMNKIIQMFDIFNIRFGATLVGPTGSGKTSCYRLLANIMTSLREAGSANPLFDRVHFQVLNPKCITMGELYGEFNELTQEWHDGLASTMMRRCVGETGPDRRWTVFDGPIDALWIENMNTVLDDNMTLCLANGERIKLKQEMKCLFEVMDLSTASPATVSRIGVVYMTPSDLGFIPYVQSWLWGPISTAPEGMPDEIKKHLFGLIEKFIPLVLKYQRKNCKEPVKCVDINLVTSLTILFQSLFTPEKGADFAGDMAKLTSQCEKCFAFCLVWSFGVSIGAEYWEMFDSFIRDCFDENGLDIRLPPTDMVYDYFVDLKDNEFVNWSKIVPPFVATPGMSYFEMVVPTPDTVRFSYVMKTLLEVNKPVFITGVTGTGKTTIVTTLFKELQPLKEAGGMGLNSIPINYSAQTSSLVVQSSIEAKMEKKRKNLLGAPSNKKLVIFVDDVNMPIVETYGAQPPVELLRQYLDHKGFYDRDKLFWKDVVDTTLFSCAAPPGGGRSEVTPRFTRHHNVLCIPPASNNALELIFTSILSAHVAKFDKGVVDLTKGAVLSTIEMYESISKDLLPTPARFHYTFNLRDISKVFQGILMITSSRCPDSETFTELWVHETSRVFYDRLINKSDQEWFKNKTVELMSRHLRSSTDVEAQFESGLKIFCDFLKVGAEKKLYEFTKDSKKLSKILEDGLEEYNSEFPTSMNLVFFSDAIEHVCRLSRILKQPRGNAMLVGVGGSGKQSTVRIASFISGYDCKQIEISRGYGIAEFREDIKEMMINAAIKGKPTTWLFTDTQIVDETMLEDINNVLNAGEVPNLFPQDELDKVCNDMAPVCKAMGIIETRENCFLTFVQLVKENLHIVLGMSPVGESLRVRCRNFPALINCCTIDWFHPWPANALVSVASHLLVDMEMPAGMEEVKNGLIQMCQTVHSSVSEFSDKFFSELRRKVYTTPKSYLDLIALFTEMLHTNQAKVDEKKERMEIGVAKLDETEGIVNSLKEELIELAPILEEKTVAAEELLKKVAVDTAEANAVKEKVEKEEAIVGKQAAEVQAIQEDAQKDLDKALPALESAVKALDSLTKADITEVKQFANPPPAVKTVMEGICIMFEEKTDWDSAKKVLARSTFIPDMKEYDKDNIPQKLLVKLRKVLVLEEMQIEKVQRVSKAATGLCMWCHAMSVYADVAKDVEPKKLLLAEMSAKMDAANKLLAEKQATLKEVVDRVESLNVLCAQTVAEKEELEAQSDLTEKRLDRAEKLTGGLADEGVRWRESVLTLGQERTTLIGDTFLACAAVSYYGPFTGTYRANLISHWNEGIATNEIPCGEKFTVANTMVAPTQIREWQNFSLPTDDVSADSAILATKARRWPLMIDPQGQANKWIRKMEESAKVAISTMNNPRLLIAVERAIRNGTPLLIEDVRETLEPSLEPVLQRATYRQGSRLLIRLGDSDVDYDENFKLYMTSKMPNPHYLPEICIKVTVINFTVTMDGLEDQLLGDVVKLEREDIEKQKVHLLLSMAEDQKKLADLEAAILHDLSSATGNILDNEQLISTLGTSKVTSNIIKSRVKESEETNISINEAREVYRRAATRGSIVYFIISDMANIDPMYQYSLDYYQSLFTKCIIESEKHDDVETRLENLINYATYTIYCNICRGLFERHKLLFSSLICFAILKHRNDIMADEWGLFMRGAGVVDRTEQAKNPSPDQISEQQWDLLYAVQTRVIENEDQDDMCMPFQGLIDSLTGNWEAWTTWRNADNPFKTKLPDEKLEASLNSFKRLILLKCLKEDKLMGAVQTFVAEQIGKEFSVAPMATMADIAKDLTNSVPCIFILSKGADPTGTLLRFAKEQGYADTLQLVSLGQGQGDYAKSLVKDGCLNGNWVLLQNCMLAKSWMGDLESLVFELKENEEKNHPNFRLFLTSSPAAYFPVSVLQSGVKMTNEPPKGVKANVRGVFNTLVKDEEWDTCQMPDQWKKLITALAFFHANVQERRKFGPLGWNIRYGFDESDLVTSIAILRRFLDTMDTIPWDALVFVTGHINYGGRVTDDWDRRCLMSILAKFIRREVLDDSYKFSVSGDYYSPSAGPLDGVKTYLSKLPDDDNPEVFGMHQNANTAFNRDESLILMSTLLSLQPREGGGGGGKSADEIVTEMADSIEAQLPAILDEEEAGETTFIVQPNGLLNSLAIVLQQEMIKFNRLLRTMGIALKDLKKAINGLIVMSGELDSMYGSFMTNQVPTNFKKVSFATLKSLGSWVKDLILRVEFFRGWLINGQPVAFPLPVFFFPQGFMTGTLQTYARKYQVAIDTLTFKFEILHEDPSSFEEGPDDGIYVHGLYLEGAKWDFDRWLLAPSDNGTMFQLLPCIHFQPAVNHKCADTDYACPVYKTSVRQGVLSTTGMSTNFVVAVEFPTDVEPDTWVLYGVAALCNLTD
jgi:dynein heavy chain